jgi:dTDP-4-amino-4,6-dideoxygalactose transaminase
VSLHATKVLSAGEGGFIVCRDAETAIGIKARANFGFFVSREACVAATNAKLSEYAAAVALASLDCWELTRAEFLRVAQDYAAALHGVAGVALQLGYGNEWVSATTNVSLPIGCIEPLEDALSAEGFGHRRWWGGGLVAHRAFSKCPRTETPVTQYLSATVLGLPCWADLPNDAIVHICETVREVCGRS